MFGVKCIFMGRCKYHGPHRHFYIQAYYLCQMVANKAGGTSLINFHLLRLTTLGHIVQWGHFPPTVRVT